MKGKKITQRITTIALLTAASLIVFAIENAFPPLFIPGAKMGLSNIFSLVALAIFGIWDALLVVIVRTVLGGLLVGTMMSMIFSLTAGVVSLLIMSLLFYVVFPKISILSISIVGAVTHNLVQNLIFCLITQTPKLFVYMPYLAIMGVVSGSIVGLTSVLIIKKVNYKKYID